MRIAALAGMMVCLAFIGSAQAPPPLIPYSGVVVDASGASRTGPTGVIFAIYEVQTGGVPLWVELQVVHPDTRGVYTAVLGSTSSGLPLELFAKGTARWLGVQVEGQNEQPRVLLTSVPYALKAGDAETLGGLPLSAFARVDSSHDAAPATSKVPARPTADDDRGFTSLQTINDSLFVNGRITTAGPGTTGHGLVIKRTNSADGGDWRLVQFGVGSFSVAYNNDNSAASKLVITPAGNVGIGTITPATKLDVAGTVKATAFEGDGSGLTNLATDALKVVDSLDQFVGLAFPNAYSSSQIPIAREVNGRWIVFFGVEDLLYSYDDSVNSASFYYTTADCTGTRYVQAGFLLTRVGSNGSTLYVPGPTVELTTGSAQFFSSGELEPCQLDGQLRSVGQVTEFDLSSFVPPFRVVQQP